MNRVKRNYESQENGKELKKHKHFHHAQRKFASFSPASPMRKEKTISTEKPPKAEDFLEFLCVRHHTPALPPELEIFTEPQLKRNELFHFDSEDELPLETVRTALQTESISDETNNVNQNGRHVLDTDSSKSSDPEDAPTEKAIPTRSNDKPVEVKKQKGLTDVKPVTVKFSEMKDFFKCISTFCKVPKPITLLAPPGNNRCTGYVFDNIQFTVTTKHIHRLKHNLSMNFVTLLSIKKQLEKESVSIDEIPKIGCCEIDLPLLVDTVNSFGGVERVNSENCWKTVVDHLSIPKTVTRRVKRIEDVYLKYILPYETLPKKDKIKLKYSVTNDSDNEEYWPSHQIALSPIDVTVFQKMAGNYHTMYCKSDTSWEDTVKLFWDTISKGERHVCAVSGEFDLLNEPQVSEGSNLLWKLQEIYSLEDSALKYLGETSKISVPVLRFEGVFSTSGWCVEKHGFSLLSYLHTGEEKVWYVIPVDNMKLFLRIKGQSKNFVTPNDLISKGCSVSRCVQKEGQYVVIQPNSYYCSVMTGYGVSEVIAFAHMNWFISRHFISHRPRLNEYVFTKMILNCSIEESKKETKSYFSQFLCQKLDSMSKIISANLKRLNACGITTCTCLKLKEPPLVCPKCKCICYMMRVRIKSKNLSLCIEDALKMINSKLKIDEFIIELLITVEKIQSLIKKLKTQQKKKRR